MKVTKMSVLYVKDILSHPDIFQHQNNIRNKKILRHISLQIFRSKIGGEFNEKNVKIRQIYNIATKASVKKQNFEAILRQF